jgi:hypothetical protein
VSVVEEESDESEEEIPIKTAVKKKTKLEKNPKSKGIKKQKTGKSKAKKGKG